MKKSSVAPGGRGIQYTLGSSDPEPTDDCAAYQSVIRRKRFERLSNHEIADAVKWSKAQEASFHLRVPKRRPHEPPATPGQLATIHALVGSITGFEMENLGSEQAEFLIDEIKSMKDIYSEIKVHEYLDRHRHRARTFFLALGIGLIGYLLFLACH